MSALEGGGDFRAAFLKNRRTDDDQEPQSGEEDEGAEGCNHRDSPSLERITKLDTLCSGTVTVARLRRCNVLYMFSSVKRPPVTCRELETGGVFD
jgi:hypothetical protein